MVPLVAFTSDRRLMGPMRNGPFTRLIAVTVAAVIIALNVFLLAQLLAGR